MLDRSVSSVLMKLLLVPEVWGSKPGLIKSDSVAPTALLRRYSTLLRSCVAQALTRGPSRLLQALT